MADETYPAPGANLTELSVSELSDEVKRHIEGAFERVRVRGELGRVARPQSGHIYFDLKDERAVLAAVIWKGAARKMPIQPEAGMEVICVGKLTTFAGQSRYQLIVERLEPAGEGALMALLEQRKKVLASEGLFDETRKRPLPFLPTTIGVVTSPSGAVIRDILHRLAERFPRHVLVWPVAVQGEQCAKEVAHAIAGFNALAADARPDLLIIARGGGALEDLWGFNEEIVARTIAQSEIPIISAIGHETDTTLADYAADRRAPTPSAAAEMAVPVRAELHARLLALGGRIAQAQSHRIANRREQVRGLTRGLARLDNVLAMPQQSLDMAAQALTAAARQSGQAQAARLARSSGRLHPSGLLALVRHMRAQLAPLAERLTRVAGVPADKRAPLASLGDRLDTALHRGAQMRSLSLSAAARDLTLLSHESVLQRGFVLVLDADGQPIAAPQNVAAGDRLDILFAHDAHLPARALRASGGAKKVTWLTKHFRFKP